MLSITRLTSSNKLFQNYYFNKRNKTRISLKSLDIKNEGRLDIESQFEIDYQYRVNLTQIFSNYSESRVEF